MFGANPFINNPAGVCATSTTLISGATLGPSHNIFMIHAAASPNNQIDVISSTGYNVAGDCLGATDAPTANHYPTAIFYHSSGKMLVGYSNNTGLIHQVYQYNASATSLTNPVLAYNDRFIVQGPVAFAELSDKSVLIASGAPALHTVEHFTYDSNSGTLRRVGNAPLIEASVYTQGISSMIVGN